MRVFELKDYRSGLASLFAQEKKLRGGRWSLARLGEKTGIQPSYLTNVTKGRAHLNSDQIYAVAEQLGLKPEETEYLDFLMQWERATNERRKKQLGLELDRLRKEHIRVSKQMPMPEAPLSEADRQVYYLDPNVELLHLYLGIENAATSIPEIARLWGLPEATVENAIAFLQKAGLVRMKGKRWVTEPPRQMLPRESPLCKPQQMLRRFRGLETLQRIPESEAYSFFATVTMTEDVKLAIQARFIEFLKEAEAMIHDSRSERIYQLQFDLFPWI